MVSKTFVCTGVVLTLAILSLAVLANSMTKPVGHDEQMYCTAGALLAQGKMIYRDFSYVAQMPYHPLLCAALFKALNTSYFLFTGRMVSVVCDILMVVCIVGIYLHIFKPFVVTGLLLGLGASVLWIFNPLVDYANGFAWNHDVVILCVTLSLWLLLSTDLRLKSRYWKVALIGVLLTLASCMRITTVMVQLVFLVFLLGVWSKSLKEKIGTALPFLVSSAIVLIWPVQLIASAPRAFFLNVFWIPVLNGKWLHEIGMAYNKVGLTFGSLTTVGYLAIIATGIYLCFALVLCRHKLKGVNTGKALVVFLVAVVMFGIAYIPSTMWRLYLTMPVSFLVLGFAYPLMWLRKFSYIKYFKIGLIIFIVGIVMTVTSHTIVLRRIPRLFDVGNWVPIRVHRISEDIAARIKEPKLILTLAPLYAIEGGSDIYTEFSAGPFVYRVADYISSWNLDITHTTGPRTLKKLVEKSPPSAVILGVEPEFLEAALFKAAVEADWERRTYDNGVTVYFRP
ncbi:hypothetical protein ES703_66778 [subsurface metagenome]